MAIPRPNSCPPRGITVLEEGTDQSQCWTFGAKAERPPHLHHAAQTVRCWQAPFHRNNPPCPQSGALPQNQFLGNPIIPIRRERKDGKRNEDWDEYVCNPPTALRLQLRGQKTVCIYLGKQRAAVCQHTPSRTKCLHGELDRFKESQRCSTSCTSMPEHNGKHQREGRPKQECSSWFTHNFLNW